MNTANLFNLQGPDLIVILLIVLLLFGAKKLPELLRGMGEALRKWIEIREEFARSFDDTMPDRTKPNVQSGTTFGLVAVVVALVFFLLVVGSRWAGL